MRQHSLTGWALVVAFTLGSGSANDKLLDVFDLEWKVSQEIKGKSFVTTVRFSPDGKTLPAIRYDGTVLFIDPATGKTKEP